MSAKFVTLLHYKISYYLTLLTLALDFRYMYFKSLFLCNMLEPGLIINQRSIEMLVENMNRSLIKTTN